MQAQQTDRCHNAAGNDHAHRHGNCGGFDAHIEKTGTQCAGRVLTQVIIFFLGITTIFVCIWLFVPKLPYMKAVLIAALVMGAVVAWADVDTVVARYNVNAYRSGQLESVDIWYLNELGDGAVPYIALLKEDSDPNVAASARSILTHTNFEEAEDFRGWNYVNHTAKDYFPLPGDTAIPKQGD